MSASGVVIRRPLPESHPPDEVAELVVVVLLDAPPRPLADVNVCATIFARRFHNAQPSSSGEIGGRSDFGGAQVVMRTVEGWLAGGSDRRKDGMALGL